MKNETLDNLEKFITNLEENWKEYTPTERWFYWSKSKEFLKSSEQ